MERLFFAKAYSTITYDIMVSYTRSGKFLFIPYIFPIEFILASPEA
jgi:hypothetical protein